MRRQSEQSAKGLAEQARAAADISAATANVARQIALITRANKEQADAVNANHVTLEELRRLGQRATSEITNAGLGPVLAQGSRQPAEPPTRR
jgi:hypothetical protein